ncbi:MAG: YraN family protein [Eubacteriales bacterium]|nr:YraN family protein [Eubacteriales bacterium]
MPESAPGQNRRVCGQQGEDMAADYLTRRGVRILARNFRDRDGEIDLVGEQDGTILFIEVKYRRDDRYGSPAEAVTAGKQKSICRTALYYLHLHHCPEQQPARFDVVSISGKDVQWLRNAFPFVR